MRGLLPYLLLGILIVLALDVAAPPVGLGMSVASWPSIGEQQIPQSVNRARKADRLPVPSLAKKDKPAPIMTACEPAFSPLSAYARLNFAGRCIS